MSLSTSELNFFNKITQTNRMIVKAGIIILLHTRNILQQQRYILPQSKWLYSENILVCTFCMADKSIVAYSLMLPNLVAASLQRR